MDSETWLSENFPNIRIKSWDADTEKIQALYALKILINSSDSNLEGQPQRFERSYPEKRFLGISNSNLGIQSLKKRIKLTPWTKTPNNLRQFWKTDPQRAPRCLALNMVNSDSRFGTEAVKEFEDLIHWTWNPRHLRIKPWKADHQWFHRSHAADNRSPINWESSFGQRSSKSLETSNPGTHKPTHQMKPWEYIFEEFRDFSSEHRPQNTSI